MRKVKKYVVGFIAGIVFALSSSVFADNISGLIGKEVEGTASVKLNGEVIGSAVIINGTSYAPVRVVSESAGMNVYYEKGVVKLKLPNIPKPKVKTAEELSADLSEFQANVQSTKQAVERIKENIASGKFEGDELTYLQNGLQRGEKQIANDEQKIADLQAKLAELQATTTNN